MQETTAAAAQNLGGQMILSPLDKRRSIGLAEAARVLGDPARTLRITPVMTDFAGRLFRVLERSV